MAPKTYRKIIVLQHKCHELQLLTFSPKAAGDAAAKAAIVNTTMSIGFGSIDFLPNAESIRAGF